MKTSIDRKTRRTRTSRARLVVAGGALAVAGLVGSAAPASAHSYTDLDLVECAKCGQLALATHLTKINPVQVQVEIGAFTSKVAR